MPYGGMLAPQQLYTRPVRMVRDVRFGTVVFVHHTTAYFAARTSFDPHQPTPGYALGAADAARLAAYAPGAGATHAAPAHALAAVVPHPCTGRGRCPPPRPALHRPHRQLARAGAAGGRRPGLRRRPGRAR